MIKLRRDNVKGVLPKHMHGLCSESVEFTSLNLFCDSLNVSTKEVSELNKLSISIQARGGSRGRPYRRGHAMRGRGRVLTENYGR